MTNRDRFEELLGLSLDGASSAEEEAELRALVDADPALAAEEQEEREIAASLRSLGNVKAPPGLAAAVMEKLGPPTARIVAAPIPTRPARRRNSVRLSAAALLLVGAGLAFLATEMESPSGKRLTEAPRTPVADGAGLQVAASTAEIRDQAVMKKAASASPAEVSAFAASVPTDDPMATAAEAAEPTVGVGTVGVTVLDERTVAAAASPATSVEDPAPPEPVVLAMVAPADKPDAASRAKIASDVVHQKEEAKQEAVPESLAGTSATAANEQNLWRMAGPAVTTEASPAAAPQPEVALASADPTVTEEAQEPAASRSEIAAAPAASAPVPEVEARGNAEMQRDVPASPGQPSQDARETASAAGEREISGDGSVARVLESPAPLGEIASGQVFSKGALGQMDNNFSMSNAAVGGPPVPAAPPAGESATLGRDGEQDSRTRGFRQAEATAQKQRPVSHPNYRFTTHSKEYAQAKIGPEKVEAKGPNEREEYAVFEFANMDQARAAREAMKAGTAWFPEGARLDRADVVKVRTGGARLIVPVLPPAQASPTPAGS